MGTAFAPSAVTSLSARLQTESFASPSYDGFALRVSAVNYETTRATTCRFLPTLSYFRCRSSATIDDGRVQGANSAKFTPGTQAHIRSFDLDPP